MNVDRVDKAPEGTSNPAFRKKLYNPGIDLAAWKQLKVKWSDLSKNGHQLRVEFRLLRDPEDEKSILAIDVIQYIDDEIVTETVQRKAGEAFATLGLAGLSRERLVEIYKDMLHELYGQTKQEDADLIVTMSPSSPVSGEIRGYTEKRDSGEKSTVSVNYQHYYLLTALREKMVEGSGQGWSKVKAVYHADDLEFYFDYS